MAELENSVTSTAEEVTTYTYLKRGSGYVELSFQLDENYSTGETYQDYLAGKWIFITEEMAAFRAEHPGASPREVITMTIPPKPQPIEPSVDDLKRMKISEIERYDTSSDVNSFYLNEMQVWLDKSTRVGLMNSITIEKNAGRTETTLWMNNLSLTIDVDKAIAMLSALELYALECYNKTAEHKNAVNSLETSEEVQAYDYKVGYPEKLHLSTVDATE